MFAVAVPVELKSPAQEIKAGCWPHVEWTLRVEHPTNTFTDHSRCGEWDEMAGDDHAGITERTSVGEISLVDDRYLVPRCEQVICRTESNNSSANDADLFTHLNGKY
jgi:hypothetical protein